MQIHYYYSQTHFHKFFEKNAKMQRKNKWFDKKTTIYVKSHRITGRRFHLIFFCRRLIKVSDIFVFYSILIGFKTMKWENRGAQDNDDDYNDSNIRIYSTLHNNQTGKKHSHNVHTPINAPIKKIHFYSSDSVFYHQNIHSIIVLRSISAIFGTQKLGQIIL